MNAREIHLLGDSFPGRPAFDTAVSRAILLRVAEGSVPETLRLYRPDDVLAFSALDRARRGFARAVAAARTSGFAPVLRLTGGRAAVFHRETLAFAWSIPVAELREGIHARFEETAEILIGALRALGVDARLGEVPGEYCPGAHSVNARGATKLAGIAQRVVRGAAHVGGVVVVRGSRRVREALVPVYRELELAFDPERVGSVEDEIGPVEVDELAAAVAAEVGRRGRIVSASVGAETLELAARLEPGQRVESDAPVLAFPAGAKAALESPR